MKSSKDYQTLVGQAENAVAGVKDPELKRIAFQKILESLISGTDDSASGSTPNRRQLPKFATFKAGEERQRWPGGILVRTHRRRFLQKTKNDRCGQGGA